MGNSFKLSLQRKCENGVSFFAVGLFDFANAHRASPDLRVRADTRMLRISPLQDAGSGEVSHAVLWKLLTSYKEGIEGIGAVGAVSEEGFFALGEFFAGFVFAKAVATTADSGGLDGEDKVVAVLTV